MEICSDLRKKLKKAETLIGEIESRIRGKSFVELQKVCVYRVAGECRLTGKECSSQTCPFFKEVRNREAKVELLHHTPLEVLMKAIRTSHASLEKLDTAGDKLGENDRKLLEKIIRMRHDSVLEHVVYTFQIEGISRALLQELSRHRHVSMTVESTRFTLRKLLSPDKLYLPVPEAQILQDLKAILAIVEKYLEHGNDVAKYFLPEAYTTNLVLTVNARELAYIISLRSRKGVLEEFRKLTRKLYEAARAVHKTLWEMLAEREGFEWEVAA